jgi:hypothetical protein
MNNEMKFHEAILDMTPGCIFKTKREEFKLIRDGSFECYGKALVLTKGMMHFEGRIVRPEPVVLSAEEILNLFPDSDSYSYLTAKNIISKCRSNFRLERDKEYEELRAAVKNCFIEEGQEEDLEAMYKLSQAYENLKPLNNK